MASNRLDLFKVCCEISMKQKNTKGLRPIKLTIFRSSPLIEKTPDTEHQVPINQPQLLTDSVILGKSLTPPGLPFSHLQNEKEEKLSRSQ